MIERTIALAGMMVVVGESKHVVIKDKPDRAGRLTRGRSLQNGSAKRRLRFGN